MKRTLGRTYLNQE
uniref:Uncharacterized protein n=1 Tax=Arundo donax TaxID=35708 RepID=A0A0A9HD67_ARUDO